MATEFSQSDVGTLNLYYIDPEDQEILQELREVRLQTVKLLSVNSNQLANEFQADFGDRFWAMARSGILWMQVSLEMLHKNG